MAAAGALLMLGIGGRRPALSGSQETEAPSAATRAAAAKAPLVERIELGEKADPGKVVAGSGLVFVSDARNREVHVIDADSRKVFKPIKLRRRPYDLDLSTTAATCGRHSRTAGSSTSTWRRRRRRTSEPTSTCAASRSPPRT